MRLQVARQLQVSSQPLILVKVRCSLGKPMTLISPSMKPAGAHQQSAQKLCFLSQATWVAGLAHCQSAEPCKACQALPDLSQGTPQEWCQHDESHPAGCWLCKQELPTLTLPACQHIHQSSFPRA